MLDDRVSGAIVRAIEPAREGTCRAIRHKLVTAQL
jgi:hypothetical protein